MNLSVRLLAVRGSSAVRLATHYSRTAQRLPVLQRRWRRCLAIICFRLIVGVHCHFSYRLTVVNIITSMRFNRCSSVAM